MGCLAQVPRGSLAAIVPETNCCCDNIVIEDLDINIDLQQINASVLRGRVTCTEGGNTINIEGAIVVATDGTDNYVGISNLNGEYSIVVPPGRYAIQAYYTQCVDDLFTPSCTCTDPVVAE